MEEKTIETINNAEVKEIKGSANKVEENNSWIEEIKEEDQITAEDLFKILDIGTDEINSAEEKIKENK